MNPTQMISPAIKQIGRELAPFGYSGSRTRVLWEEPDAFLAIQNSMGQWLSNIGEAEAVFRRFVYENTNLQDTDLRQHRIGLYALLCDGEALAFDCNKYGAAHPDERTKTGPLLAVIEQKLGVLFDTLVSWHGDLHSQQDIPDSFKKSAKELEEGKIVEFEIPQ